METFSCQFNCIHDNKIYLVRNLASICYDLSICEFSMSEISISTFFLKLNSNVKVVTSNNKVSIEIEPTDQLYFNLIYDFFESSSKEIVLICKKVDSSNDIKKIKLSSIISLETNQPLQVQDPVKLISRPILTDVSSDKNWFTLSQVQQNSKPNMTAFFQKGQKSFINKVFKHYFQTESKKSMSIADFYYYNKISHDTSPNIFLGQQVEIIENNNRAYFKLTSIRKKTALVENNSAVFQSKNESELMIHKNFEKCRYPLFCLGIKNLKQEFAKYYISPGIFNRSLDALIGLAVYEHLFRFEDDEEFFKYFKEKIIDESIWRFFSDLTPPSKFSDFSSLHHYMIDHLANIREIGRVFSPKTFMTGSLKSIQDLSNLTGCCIHYFDLTEGVDEYKLIPIKELQNRPIIKLGRYFSEYFLVYSGQDMIKDGFDPNSYLFYQIQKPLSKDRNFYDNLQNFDFACLDILIESFTVKLKKMNENITKKINGQSYDHSYDFNLDAEISLFNESMFKQFRHPPLPSIEKLKEVKLAEAVYLVNPNKYCCCHCGLYFIENTTQKVKFNCNHDFALEHLGNYYLNVCPICNYFQGYFNSMH